MTIEERNEWMNEKALQKNAVEIVEMLEQRDDTEGFWTCRE